MIAVDSSALLAILLNEPEAPACIEALIDATSSYVSSFTLFETRVVIQRVAAHDGLADLAILLERSRVLTVPFDDEQAAVALDAYRRYGKGIHPAGLNIGDCASYALAKSRNLPLLFKGNDFARTDIASALESGTG